MITSSISTPADSALISAALSGGQLDLAMHTIESALHSGHAIRMSDEYKPFLAALRHAHWRRWGELLRSAESLRDQEIAALEDVLITALKKAPLKCVMRFKTTVPALTAAQNERLATSKMPLPEIGLARYHLRPSAFEHGSTR